MSESNERGSVGLKTRLSLTISFLMASLPSIVSGFSSPTGWSHPFTSGKQRLYGSQLNVFAFNLNKKDDDRDKATDDDTDFPIWVKGLRQWPLYPAKSSLLNEVSEQEEELAREVLDEPPVKRVTRIPLANLVNVEALLMASGDDVMEDQRDLALFEINQYVSEKPTSDSIAQTTPLSFISNLQEFGDWNNVVLNLRNSVANLTTETSSNALSAATESTFKEATARLEYLVSEVSTAISPQTVQSLILRAGKTLKLNEGAANDLVAVAEKVALEQGLDVREAAERARETTKLTTNFVKMANDLLVSGYARKDTNGQTVVADTSSRPLFDDFESARLIAKCDYEASVVKASEMGILCGAIYEDTLQITGKLGHSIVANGTTENVAWMVTDSIGYNQNFTRIENSDDSPFLVRTITIRGFDASDENVDREELLLDICTASPEAFGNGVLLHAGLLKLARKLYPDVVSYIDNAAPSHKVVITGHSVGGSLSVLLLLLLTQERGADFVNKKIARVYTFGSPPVATVGYTPQLDLENGSKDKMGKDSLQNNDTIHAYSGSALTRFGLPTSIVYGYVQPWDPIARLFSEIDPLYPLIGDIGKDGKTPYASGPPRTLRPITRAIIESWEGWPRFRDSFKATVNQNYTSVGVQHILLSEPVRYISDQLVAVNVQVPPMDSMVQISSKELLPALASLYPVDVFRISFVPVAIRSFVHHFFPAYGEPIVDYTDKNRRRSIESNKSGPESRLMSVTNLEVELQTAAPNGGGTAGKSSQWLQFPPDW
jgi:hypothetical protein